MQTAPVSSVATWLSPFGQIVDRPWIDQVAAARGTEPDRIRTSWPRAGIPVATRDEYLERLAELEALGISRVYFQVGFDSPDDIRRSIGLLVS